MADEATLQIEIRKLKEQRSRTEASIASIKRDMANVPSKYERNKDAILEKAKQDYQSRQRDMVSQIERIYQSKLKEVKAFLDSCPDLSAKEFKGKYEVRAIEEKLYELYPDVLVDNYICAQPYEFDTEGEAYQVYTSAEKMSAMLGKNSVAASLFTGMVDLMERAANFRGLGSKVLLIVIGIFFTVSVFFPFMLISTYMMFGISAAVYGLYVATLLKKLYSIKEFLNDEYNEDIFQQDASDFYSEAESFLSEVKEDFLTAIKEQPFIEPVDAIAQQEQEKARELTTLENKIKSLNESIEVFTASIFEKENLYNTMVEARLNAVQTKRVAALETYEWEYKWLEEVLVDITNDGHVVTTKWSKTHSLFVSKETDILQEFARLAVYQNVIHVHPYFGSQVVLDSKYMGGQLIPFSKLLPAVCQVLTDAGEISSKLEEVSSNVRARFNKILSGSASIEEFNELMTSYGGNGESYLTLHIFGINSLTQQHLSIIKNGVKVGIFVKLYLTFAEFQSVIKDFPVNDFQELYFIDKKPIPATYDSIVRMSKQG